ncbi:hypothetical protein L6241_02520 [Janibacter sp. Y6]|uniref:hypothetical protein n=1 Tax=Janibacter sp. Y6 TaxID=2913552 RepID=UPI0034A40EAF
MYGENGAQMRTELAALLRQHRIMRRLAEDSSVERAAAGQQILRFRQTVLVWCAQAIGVARPLTFPNVPQKPADPFRAASDHGAAVAELARALEAAPDQATTLPASSQEFTTPSANSVIEHWRLAARAAALAEHDTAPDQAIHLTAAQARTIAGDVAAISQALVVLDRRYQNTPGWELPSPGAIGSAGRRSPQPWTSALGSLTTASTKQAGANGPSPSEAQPSRECSAYSKPSTTCS